MTEATASSALLAADNDTDPATYEQLAQLELTLDTIDNRLVSIQNHLSAPIYEQRTAVIRKIPKFWSLVLEQAPPEIDQYIQPSDSALFAACLENITVKRFEIPDSLPTDAYASVNISEERDGTWGEPRSLKIIFEFSPNQWFRDAVLEKTFFFRRAKDGWSGLVSEPVKILWNKGKDLTDGLLDAAVALGAAEQQAKAADGAAGVPGDGKGKEKVSELPEAAALRKLLESSAGNLSFFTWFGFRGRSISAEESAEAWDKFNKGEKPTTEEDMEDEDEDEDLEDLMDDLETEVFPDGDDLAVALAEDLWPGAIRYFTQSQEEDYISDIDFEDHDMDDEDDVPDIRSLVKDSQKGNGPPSKKRKT